MSDPAEEKRPKFGNRLLSPEDDVFQHNAWDDVEWDQQQEQEAQSMVDRNSEVKFAPEVIDKYESEANGFWNSFYDVHSNGFFKDRHWLFTEFPELAKTNDNPTQPTKVLEIGCGVGNTIIPLLQYHMSESPCILIYGCDFSHRAIEILTETNEYKQHGDMCKAFVLDASQSEWTDVPFEANTLDVVVLIFVLSSINPNKYDNVISNVYKYLKPGGVVLFRDYGRYDLAQLRFKPGRSLGDNFYARGDGTRVYFSTQSEVGSMFEKSGFKELENRVDRRLQVNRGRQLKMYRVWIQAKYIKH